MAICLWEMQFKENVRQEERTWRGEGTFSTHVRMARIAVHTGIIGCRNVSRGWHREANGLVTWLLLGSHMTTARGSHDYCQGDHMTGHMTSVKGITWLVTWLLLLKGSHDYCQGVTKTIGYIPEKHWQWQDQPSILQGYTIAAETVTVETSYVHRA